MRQGRGSTASIRSSALWGKPAKGETRSSALWGKGGRGFALLVALVVALAAPAAARADAFVPQELLDKAAEYPGAKIHVIIVGRPGVDPGDIKNDKMKDSNGNQFGQIRREFKLMDAVAADITGGQLLALAKQDGIRSIVPDAPVVASHDESTDFSTLQLWPHVIGADTLWAGLDLDGDDELLSLEDDDGVPQAPAIAVVDSGVEPGLVADFGGRVVANVDFTSLSSEQAKDDLGHGTMVAGLAAGSSTSYPGVAPTADIVSLRVLDKDGKGIMSDVIAAADWIYQNRESKNIRVANFSLNSPHPNWGLHDPLNQAVRRLWLSGTVVVTSAGNKGPQRMLFAPASEPFVITVGAVDIADTEDVGDDFNAPWSSYGYTAEGFAKPEVAAPGRYMVAPVPVTSTLATLLPERIVAPGYMWMSGTSFAAPVVSGAAAQILAYHPDWTPDQVKGALMLTARPLPNADPMSVGVGEIDAAAAAALDSAPDANEHLKPFVGAHPAHGYPIFSAASWASTASADASWASASWASASWASASWSSASWASASWASASWADASWASASWASASWASASWASASWASASWAQ